VFNPTYPYPCLKFYQSVRDQFYGQKANDQELCYFHRLCKSRVVEVVPLVSETELDAEGRVLRSSIREWAEGTQIGFWG